MSWADEARDAQVEAGHDLDDKSRTECNRFIDYLRTLIRATAMAGHGCLDYVPEIGLCWHAQKVTYRKFTLTLDQQSYITKKLVANGFVCQWRLYSPSKGQHAITVIWDREIIAANEREMNTMLNRLRQ